MRPLKAKLKRPAFTLIEVIVSVIIIAFVVLSLMEISSRTEQNAIYLSQRNTSTFYDSLYLLDDSLVHHKKNKNSYELLRKHFKIKEDKSKDALKSITRDIIVPEPLQVPSAADSSINAEVTRLILKDQYTSTYYRFELSSF